MPPETAPRRPAARAGGVPLDAAAAARLKLTAYAASLGVAFALFLAVAGPGQGTWFWLWALGACLALAWGWVRGGTLVRLGADAALVLALAVPLGPVFASGAKLGQALLVAPPWPQMLVALFASRVLSEDCALGFARVWRGPIAPGAPVRAQSVSAAVALGSFLTLAFYTGLAFAGVEKSGATSFSAIVLDALVGETAVHRAILALFFVILAYLGETALQHRADRAAFRGLQAALQRRGRVPGGPSARDALAEALAGLGPSGATQLVEDAFDRAGDPRPAGLALRAASLAAFRAGSRRFVRSLLPFLPMLGFFGTVVGLATAMAALPTSAPGGGGVDITESLSGLAVKFQTTLLGIMASLIASAALNLVEKSEAELAAECALLVARVEDGDAAAA